MVEDLDDTDEPLRHEPDGRGRRVRAIGMIATAVGLLVIGGIGGAILSERRQSARAPAEMAAPVKGSSDGSAASPATGHGAHGTAGGAPAASSEAAEIALTADALQRAGIEIAPVTADATHGSLTVPGTVTSNAYRETKVNSLVGGIVREVKAHLGANVRNNEPIAVIFSTELADAQMKYLSMQAMLRADDQKFDRTRKLVDLGAASRQELDDATAARAARATEVAAARQRLILLGLHADQIQRLTEPAQIVSELIVSAPEGGVVIARAINPGQVVAAGQELFVVADLGTVWVIGDLYEKDFANVRVGTPATVSIPALRSGATRGRVAYIDPRVDPATRTAKVRVEVPNGDGALRLGMFAEVTFSSAAGARRTVVPRAAVQSIGGRSVVYVATDDEGRFLERSVELGALSGETVEVISGVKVGERVATKGSFYLRAEAGRARGQ